MLPASQRRALFKRITFKRLSAQCHRKLLDYHQRQICSRARARFVFLISHVLIPFAASRTQRTVGDVERSLEVLDNVLSEYDERDTPLSSLEPGGEAGVGAAAAAATARTASALITAPRQSEDDGYVSMNGRRYVGVCVMLFRCGV